MGKKNFSIRPAWPHLMAFRLNCTDNRRKERKKGRGREEDEYSKA
jgi:hypothetical protein